MKYLFYTIIFSLFIISVSCDDDCDEEFDLTTIDACEYILAPHNTTQKFSNDLTTFELHFGPDTLEVDELFSDRRIAIFKDTDVECFFGCRSNEAGTASLGSINNFQEQWEEEEWYEKIEAEDYIEDETLDTRSWIGDVLEASYLHPNAYPLMITLVFGFHVNEEIIGGYDSIWGTSILYREDGEISKPAADIRVFGNLVEHIDQREVNGITYEDVILVEVGFKTFIGQEFQDGNDSLISNLVYSYWFAKDIGLIETTDHNFKLIVD